MYISLQPKKYTHTYKSHELLECNSVLSDDHDFCKVRHHYDHAQSHIRLRLEKQKGKEKGDRMSKQLIEGGPSSVQPRSQIRHGS